jgi:hypothetical protein
MANLQLQGFCSYMKQNTSMANWPFTIKHHIAAQVQGVGNI